MWSRLQKPKYPYRSVIAVVGPTAVGKSALALRLARALDGEIIVADSRQVYGFMNIGTAKASPEERKLVPHHLIDVVNPDEGFSLALYQQMAYNAIEDVQRRGKVAVIEGGTGLYVWAVLEGFQIPEVPPNCEFREAMEARVAVEGYEELYRELQTKDPAAAERIDPRNVRRVIRALEVHAATGAAEPQRQARIDAKVIGLTADREELYRSIDSRVESMLERGLVEEVQQLTEKGYNLELSSFSSPGYREIGLYLKGELDLAEAVRQIKVHTHKLARRQYAWFRPTDKRIEWFDVKEGTDRITEKVVEELIENPLEHKKEPGSQIETVKDA